MPIRYTEYTLFNCKKQFTKHQKARFIVESRPLTIKKFKAGRQKEVRHCVIVKTSRGFSTQYTRIRLALPVRAKRTDRERVLSLIVLIFAPINEKIFRGGRSFYFWCNSTQGLRISSRDAIKQREAAYPSDCFAHAAILSIFIDSFGIAPLRLKMESLAARFVSSNTAVCLRTL